MNAPQPSLVVIVPTKNRRTLLARAIESCRSQAYRAWRIVIVDDGSTDGTREYVGSLSDPRITVIRFERGKGVNAARNSAIRTLRKDEWAVFLDDDDTLLPEALERVASGARSAPEHIDVLFFNTEIVTSKERFEGGYRFSSGESFHDPSYYETMTKHNLQGDCKPVIRASLFSRGHLFSEDINGFESEFFMDLARQSVGIRYMPDKIMTLDQSHDEERLSHTAATRDPSAFTRANIRIFRDHARFFAEYPRVAMQRAGGAIKVALRAYDPLHAALFSFYYLCALSRVIFGQGEKDKEE